MSELVSAAELMARLLTNLVNEFEDCREPMAFAEEDFVNQEPETIWPIMRIDGTIRGIE